MVSPLGTPELDAMHDWEDSDEERTMFNSKMPNYVGFSWEDELQLIIDEWSEGQLPLDGDEVDDLVNLLRDKINLMQGNITWEEYLNG